MRGEASAYKFDDFTERAYKKLLRTARRGYRFEFFGVSSARPHVLLRHDVDMSVHRALRMATMESDAGARSTYFLLPHGEFYNLLEGRIAAMVRRIASLGHAIGLHFDTGFYGAKPSAHRLLRAARTERAMLQDLAGVAVSAVSFHDPSPALLARFDGPRFAGMINAYGRTLRARYKYCSDSNGYWRYDRLGDLLDPAMHPRLQLLTHPEWWVPAPLSPYQRVRRCVDGRRDAVLADYAGALRRDGRKNVGA